MCDNKGILSGLRFRFIAVQGGKVMKLKDALCQRIFQLCEERDMTINGLCYIIYGRNNSTNVSTIQKICDGLEIDLPTFFDSDIFKDVE